MNDERILGRSLATGVATGVPYFINRAPVRSQHRSLVPAEIPDEIHRFVKSAESALSELKQLSSILEAEGRVTDLKLIDTHVQLLQDPSGISKLVIDTIADQRLSVEFSLKHVLKQLKTQFSVIEDEVLSERYSDIEDVGNRIFEQLKSPSEKIDEEIPKGAVLVADHISFSRALDAAGVVSAFIARNGSSISHTAILARARAIPYVVNIDISTLKGAHQVTVDGDQGSVVINPTRVTNSTKRYSIVPKIEEALHQSEFVSSIKLMANIEHPHDLKYALQCNLSEVGLLRTEYLFSERRVLTRLPTEKQQIAFLKKCNVPGFNRFVIRALDMSSEKFPLLYRGLRGIQFLLHETEFFKCHLKAIVQAFPQGCSVLLPFVSEASEIAKASEVFHEVLKDTHGSDSLERFQLGAMIETPKGVLEVEEILGFADFISIGSNDLIQYSLGIDRSTTDFSGKSGLHEGVLELLSVVIAESAKMSKSCTLCGEIAAEESVLPQLIALGLKQISLTPRKAGHVRSLLHGMNPDHVQKLIQLRQMQPSSLSLV